MKSNLFKKKRLDVSGKKATGLLPSSTRRIKPLKLSGTIYSLLDDFQKPIVKFSLAVKTAALFLDQGTGKTWVALSVIEELLSDSFQGFAVVNLNNKVSTWQKLLTEFLPQVNVCSSIVEFRELPCPKLLLLHYEELRPIIKKLIKISFTIIIYDESQRLKQRTSLQSRHSFRLRNSAEYKLILSGTPMDERPIDLWAQFRFLNPQVLGTKWADFDAEFLEPLEGMPKGIKPGTFKWIKLMRSLNIRRRKRKFDFNKLPEFLDLIAPYCYRIDQSVLGLKPIEYETVLINMFGKQREQYDTLERDLVIKLKKKTLTAPMKVILINKLHQICGGYVKDEDGEVHQVGRAKLRRLKLLIKPRNFPIVIFCNYTAEVNALVAELKSFGRIQTLTGKTKKKDRPGIQARFQKGLIDILICQKKTGGVGIDLFASNYAFMYSFRHSFIDFDQAVKRLQRRGQKRTVKIVLLLVRNSIDIDIKEAVIKKRNVIEHVFNKLVERSLFQWPKKKIPLRNLSTESQISQNSSASNQHRLVSNSGRTRSKRRAVPTAGTRMRK